MVCISQIYTQSCVPFLVIQFAMGEKITICPEEAAKGRKGILVTKWRQTMAEKCSPTETQSLKGKDTVMEQKTLELRPDICRLQERERKVSCPLSQGQQAHTISN